MTYNTDNTTRRALLAGLAAAPLAALPVVAATGPSELQAIAARVEELWQQRDALLKAGREEDANFLTDEECDLTHRMLELPARSLADLAAKTRVAELTGELRWDERPNMEMLAARALESEGLSDHAIALNILRDVMRLQASA